MIDISTTQKIIFYTEVLAAIQAKSNYRIPRLFNINTFRDEVFIAMQALNLLRPKTTEHNGARFGGSNC